MRLATNLAVFLLRSKNWSDEEAIHLIVRATYLPNSVRCTLKDGFRRPPFHNGRDGGLRFLCYTDIRVNEYIVGEGPSNLTVVIDSYRGVVGERDQQWAESVIDDEFGGREKIMLIGVETDHSVEAFRIRHAWNMVRRDGGAVMVHHPWRSYWLGEDAAKYRSEVEWTVDAFKKEALAAHKARIEKYNGRIADGTEYPRIITNASNLHAYYVETGAVNHPDGPPERKFPPACGLAVPDYGQNPGLVRDCRALLAAKDALRGTGTLDWGVDTTISEWEGVMVEYGRVVALVVNDKELTGTVSAELTKLTWWLEELRLSGNSLTGCIPVGLRDVPNHDLDQLGLPDCAAG